MEAKRRKNGEASAENDDPLGQLRQTVDRARRLEPIEMVEPPTEDPLEKLESLMDRARRESEGEGAEALRRLEDRIERAHWIPEPEPYEPPEGDPLERLKARMRGELEEPVSTEETEQVERPSDARISDTGGRDAVLGEALRRSLRSRPLPGPLRAEIAARLAELMEDEEHPQLQELWELVVFGNDDDSSIR